MQTTIAAQLGLDTTTVANFFMNARRRGVERFRDHAQRYHQQHMQAQHYHPHWQPPPPQQAQLLHDYAQLPSSSTLLSTMPSELHAAYESFAYAQQHLPHTSADDPLTFEQL